MIQDDARIREICGLIATEQDSQKFLELVTELNQLLGAENQKMEQSDHIHLAS